VLVTNAALETLDLTGNNIGDAGAEMLAVVLERNTALKELKLESNGIGSEGAAKLATALETNSALTTLDLKDNNIGDDGVSKLATALETNAALATLKLSCVLLRRRPLSADTLVQVRRRGGCLEARGRAREEHRTQGTDPRVERDRLAPVQGRGGRAAGEASGTQGDRAHVVGLLVG